MTLVSAKPGPDGWPETAAGATVAIAEQPRIWLLVGNSTNVPAGVVCVLTCDLNPREAEIFPVAPTDAHARTYPPNTERSIFTGVTAPFRSCLVPTAPFGISI